jgi:hypothetical protein
MLLCDFTKAFDLVDHTIVINKMSECGVHDCLLKWSANFLSQRTQRVKIGNHISQEVEMHAGCPQGTLLGPLAFVMHINDLEPPGNVVTIKYVDDTTVLHATKCDGDDTMQETAIYLHDWALNNNMCFNVKKTKEIVFAFGSNFVNTPPIMLGDAVIEQVKEAKILGVTIQSNLKWNSHVENIIKKANKRLYLLRLCKRSGVKSTDLIDIYTSLIRSVLEYCCVVWHSSLPAYLHYDIERVQKRAMRIIFSDNDYDCSLHMADLETLYIRRERLCTKLFKEMCMPSHKLHELLPKTDCPYYL